VKDLEQAHYVVLVLLDVDLVRRFESLQHAQTYG